VWPRAASATPVCSRMAGHPSSMSVALSNCARGFSLPRHERRVDHIGDALAAHRPDGKIHVFEPESVGRDLLQRKALRGKLRESELARLEAMTARALDGD